MQLTLSLSDAYARAIAQPVSVARILNESIRLLEQMQPDDPQTAEAIDNNLVELKSILPACDALFAAARSSRF